MGGGLGPKVSPLFHLRINEIRIGLREKKRVHDAVFSSIFLESSTVENRGSVNWRKEK